MTDPEFSEEKNEQELNLFADQSRPEDTSGSPDAAEGTAVPAGETVFPADAADIPEQESPIPEQPVRSDAAPDDSPVVAPPPPRKKPAVMRPGIVPPAGRTDIPSVSSTASGASAQNAHKPLPHPLQQDQTLGQMLAGIRNVRGMSLEEVALTTRIRMEYLLELERDELLKKLPVVYVSAYVRKLAEVYDLSGEDTEALIEKMNGETPQNPKELPDKLLESVNEGALVNEDEKKRIRKLTIAFFVAVGIVVLAIIWLIVLAVAHYAKASGSDPAVGVQPAESPVPQTILMDESELDALIVPETPSISVLKMNKTPGIRDTP